jgi:hypothetical protein
MPFSYQAAPVQAVNQFKQLLLGLLSLACERNRESRMVGDAGLLEQRRGNVPVPNFS